MDGVSWSTTAAHESFSRSKTASDTLSRLASFIARAETKQHTRSQREPTSQLSTYVCQECGKGFPYATDLLHHQEAKHTLPKPHRCPSCGQEFSLRSSLQLHKCDHDCKLCQGESRLGSPCPACSTHTSDRLLDSSPYACAPCGRGFNQKQALLHHQQAGCSEPLSPSDVVDATSLPDDSPPLSEGDSAPSDSSDIPGPSHRSVNACKFCSRTFGTQARLHRHTERSHTEEWLMASQDTKGQREELSNAITKVNGHVHRKPKSQTKFLNCRSCDMVFRSTSKLYVHRKEKHSREKNIMTEQRPVITKRRRTGTYPCQVCSKVFLHHLSLRAHYRQHTSSSFTTFKMNSHSVGHSTKDSTLSEHSPNKTSLDPNKTVRAGPGRPRKVARLKMCRKVPQAKETEVDDGEEEDREFPCPSCAEVFSLQSQLREHVELHQSSVNRRQCSVCTHEMEACKWPGSKRQRLYHCVPCQQGFAALESFLEHCQEHLRVRVEEDSIAEATKA